MQLGINAIKQSQKIAFHDSACQFPDNYCHLHHYYKPFCCKIRQSRGKESLHFTSSNLDYTFHIPYTLPFFFEPVKGTPLHYGSCPLSHYIVSYEGIYRKKNRLHLWLTTSRWDLHFSQNYNCPPNHRDQFPWRKRQFHRVESMGSHSQELSSHPRLCFP